MTGDRLGTESHPPQLRLGRLSRNLQRVAIPMRKWILRAAVALAMLLVALGAAAWAAARHFQPYVRAMAIRYLEERFGTGVELGSFRVSVFGRIALEARDGGGASQW